MRDRSFENQRCRASGLNLVTAAIVLWNTVYLERAILAIKDRGETVDEKLLQHLSPLGWEHNFIFRFVRGPHGHSRQSCTGTNWTRLRAMRQGCGYPDCWSRGRTDEPCATPG